MAKGEYTHKEPKAYTTPPANDADPKGKRTIKPSMSRQPGNTASTEGLSGNRKSQAEDFAKVKARIKDLASSGKIKDQDF